MVSLFNIPPADFIGQGKADNILTTIIISSALISLLGGYVYHSLAMIFKMFSAGVLLASLAVIPPWPYQRRNPVKFARDPEPVNEKNPTSTDKSKMKSN